MKKTLLSLLVGYTPVALAIAPYAVRVSQLGPTGTTAGATVNDFTPPPSNEFGFVVVDGNNATKRAVFARFESNQFELLNLTGIAGDLQGVFNLKSSYITWEVDQHLASFYTSTAATKATVDAMTAGTVDDFVDGTGALQDLATKVDAWATSRAIADQAYVANPSNISQDASHRFVTDSQISDWTAKQDNISPGSGSQYYRGDKTWQTLDKNAVGLSNVPNLDSTNPANIVQASGYRFVTDTEKSTWNGKVSPGTTLAHYGIVDAYPLSGNPSNFLTGITSGQVTTALGFTPYNASNPTGFVTQSGARSAISLTTTGTSGAATYNSGTGVLNIPNYAGPASVTINSPSRTLVNATNATGFQVSANKPVFVAYEGKMSTITQALVLSAGASEVEVVLETADTNSTTPSAWTVRARQNSSQNIALGVAITSTDGEPWSLSRWIEAGKFIRIRTNVITGTGATFSINAEQQEVVTP